MFLLITEIHDTEVKEYFDNIELVAQEWAYLKPQGFKFVALYHNGILLD